MKIGMILFLSFFAKALPAQNNHTISVMDFVQIKNNKRAEALYFYENNWKVYRDSALKKGYIKSYTLLTTSRDSINNFDIILVTEYADSLQYKKSEERFNLLIKEIRPNGPKLANDLQPAEFRINIHSAVVEGMFSGAYK